MPRTRGQRQSFTFNKGWNTEASPLTFPENTASDLDNVILDVDGSVRRRLGVACESATSTRYFGQDAPNFTYKAIGFFKWTNVAGSGDYNLLVSQFGTTLQFNQEDGTDIGQVDFSDAVIPIRASVAPNEVVSVASGLGYLFVTGPSIDPFYITYDTATDTVSKTVFEIKIRDFDGIDEGTEVDERPGSLTAAHEYNLRNQGWPNSFQCINDSATKTTTDPIDYTKTVLGVYPSNADILYLGKTVSGTDESEIDRYNPNTMAKNVFGTTPAPRGKYIYNAFNIDRNTKVLGAEGIIVNNRPGAIGFHNGRVFYSGVNAVGYTGKVYYSQQLTNINKIGKCYQENDPTAEDYNALLATDGGEIDIPNCGNILRIEEGPAGIVVFASNGMWEITGQEGKFSATEFYVRKVTDLGCIGSETVINADGKFFYWSDAGIVGTASDQITGNISADVITQTSIQLGYLLFGGPQRRGARGQWIRGEKKAVWLYSTDTEYDGVSNRFKYNGVLILDIILGAFYKYSISDFNIGAAPYVSGLVESSSTVSITQQEPVTAGGLNVTAGGSTVTTPVTGVDADTVTSTWKLQVVRPRTVGTTAAYGLDFATFASRTFTDWYFEDNVGANYTSFLETGFDYGGQAMFDKAPTYVYTYMSRVSKSNLDGGYYNIPDPTGVIAGLESCVDVITSTYGNQDDVSTFVNNSKGLDFQSGGQYMYVAGTNPANSSEYRIHQFELTTPWNVTTASTSANNYIDITADLDSAPGNFNWTYDGRYMDITLADGSKTYEATIPSTWGITGLSVTSTFIDWSTETPGSVYATCWNKDWTKFYAAAAGGSTIYEYSVSLPGRLSGLTQTNSYDISSEVAVPVYGITFTKEGDGFAVLTATRVYGYSLSTNFDLSTKTFTQSSVVVDDIGSTASAPWGLNYETTNGDSLFIVSSTDDIVYEGVLDCSICGTKDAPYLERFLNVGVSSQGVYILPDGTRMWVRPNNNTISEYSLSTPYDVTSAVFVQSNTGLSVGLDVWFNSTGTRLATTATGSTVIYSLSTPFDISTISLLSSSSAVNPGIGRGIYMSDDGLEVYICGAPTVAVANSIYKWTLDAAWDLSSYTYNGSSSFGSEFGNSDVRGIRYQEDLLFVTSNNSWATYTFNSAAVTKSLVELNSGDLSGISCNGIVTLVDSDGIYHFYYTSGGSNRVFERYSGC